MDRPNGPKGGGTAHEAAPRPGFKGFRGFCLPLAGGFKGCGGGSRRKYKKGAAWRLNPFTFGNTSSLLSAAILYNSPLNQPALWAEPIGQCVST